MHRLMTLCSVKHKHSIQIHGRPCFITSKFDFQSSAPDGIDNVSKLELQGTNCF